jgi:polysaccharide export outer membrane protein
MSLAKPGAVYVCFLATAISGMLLQSPAILAQTPIETQQQANERIRTLSASTVTPPHDYVIGRGDLVSVEVYDIPELTRDVRVSQTGTIGLPLLPMRVYVAGLTEMQVQQKIAEVLQANGLVMQPRVMVAVKEKKSKPITIVGAVAHPMVYQADRSVTLVQALAEAGGISADASDIVIVTRGASAENVNSEEPPEIGKEDVVPTAGAPTVSAQSAGLETKSDEAANKNLAGDQQPAFPRPETQAQATATTPPLIAASDSSPPSANMITVNLAELLERGDTQNNIPLQGGDVVTVPHAGIVYALGAVQRPGGFVANNDRAQLSTLKLLALAGGMTRIAKKDRALIIRKDATGKQLAIPVDLGKIVAQKSEDVRLMPSDILYVPDNATKAALIRATEIGLAVGTGLVIYRLGSR